MISLHVDTRNARQTRKIARLYTTFEECRFEHDGADAWRARDLMPRLGYANWQNFREAIRRALQSCQTAYAQEEDRLTRTNSASASLRRRVRPPLGLPGGVPVTTYSSWVRIPISPFR
jgi:hypothetical protein